MDPSEFENRVERLKAVNEVISELDETIRTQAFALLSRYVTGQVESSDEGQTRSPEGAAAAGSWAPRRREIG